MDVWEKGIEGNELRVFIPFTLGGEFPWGRSAMNRQIGEVWSAG